MNYTSISNENGGIGQGGEIISELSEPGFFGLQDLINYSASLEPRDE
ncbi:MAG: hypothetical protein JWQ57_1256 [Mucilaginibacter sp.]|nr:hypothetical protein [Mucilaginibacter sp.]